MELLQNYGFAVYNFFRENTKDLHFISLGIYGLAVHNNTVVLLFLNALYSAQNNLTLLTCCRI
jgi:hypothetical protein